MYRLMDSQAHMRTDGPSYKEPANRAKAIAHGEAASPNEVVLQDWNDEVWSRGAPVNLLGDSLN